MVRATIDTTIYGLPYSADQTVQAVVDKIPTYKGGWKVDSFSADTAGTLPRTMPVHIVLESDSGDAASARATVAAAIADAGGSFAASWGNLAVALGKEVVVPTVQQVGADAKSALDYLKGILPWLAVGLGAVAIIYGLTIIAPYAKAAAPKGGK